MFAVALLSVGDFVSLKGKGSPYMMVGMPDGLRVFGLENGDVDLLMNHDLLDTPGAVRDHGYAGARKYLCRSSELETAAQGAQIAACAGRLNPLFLPGLERYGRIRALS